MIKFIPGLRKKIRDLVGDFPNLDLVTDLLERMLAIDPLKRPSPLELLSHPLFAH